MGRPPSIPCECGGWARYQRRDDGMAYLECNKCGGVFELKVSWNEIKHTFNRRNELGSEKLETSNVSKDQKSSVWFWMVIGILSIWALFRILKGCVAALTGIAL